MSFRLDKPSHSTGMHPQERMVLEQMASRLASMEKDVQLLARYLQTMNHAKRIVDDVPKDKTQGGINRGDVRNSTQLSQLRDQAAAMTNEANQRLDGRFGALYPNYQPPGIVRNAPGDPYANEEEGAVFCSAD